MRNDKEKYNHQGKISKRRFTQVAMLLATNSYFQGFVQKTIFRGKSKYVCVPGMNCYSCPGALGACPIGSLQAVIGSIKYKTSFYVGGLIALFGVIFGRFICGWLCVFGLIEDLLYKIPLPKLKIPEKVDNIFRWLKYVILLVFVLGLPSFLKNQFGIAPPYFCEWICPVGTLEGGIPLVLLKESLRNSIGFLFYWKFAILIFILILSMVTYRPFCKYLCPLGAIYGIFNKISIVGLQLNKETCVSCNKCKNVCPMQVNPCEKPDSSECIRCGVCAKACPKKSISLGIKNRKK